MWLADDLLCELAEQVGFAGNAFPAVCRRWCQAWDRVWRLPVRKLFHLKPPCHREQVLNALALRLDAGKLHGLLPRQAVLFFRALWELPRPTARKFEKLCLFLLRVAEPNITPYRGIIRKKDKVNPLLFRLWLAVHDGVLRNALIESAAYGWLESVAFLCALLRDADAQTTTHYGLNRTRKAVALALQRACEANRSQVALWLLAQGPIYLNKSRPFVSALVHHDLELLKALFANATTLHRMESFQTDPMLHIQRFLKTAVRWGRWTALRFMLSAIESAPQTLVSDVARFRRRLERAEHNHAAHALVFFSRKTSF